MKFTTVFGSAVLLSAAPSYAMKIATNRSPGCGKPVPDGITLGKSKNQTIESTSGVTPRKYRIHLPKSYDSSKPVPLIFSYHGRTKDMKSQEKLSQFSDEAYGFEGISIYPEGVPSKKGSNQWQGDPEAPDSINDVTFTLELLDFVKSSYCIDITRVYAAGKSNGGGFAGGQLACDEKATTKFAAFAAVAGAFYLDSDDQPLPCNPTKIRKDIPIMELHGFNDTTIKYAGGPNNRSNANTTDIITWVEDWAKRNKLDPEAKQTSQLCSGDKLVTRYSWDDVVLHYNYTNMKHDWPSTHSNSDTDRTTCEEADATKIILDWFSKQIL